MCIRDRKEIEDFAFYGCKRLSKIDLTACGQLRRIGESAFEGCAALRLSLIHIYSGDEQQLWRQGNITLHRNEGDEMPLYRIISINTNYRWV